MAEQKKPPGNATKNAPANPPANNPFLAARERLQKLVPKESAPKSPASSKTGAEQRARDKDRSPRETDQEIFLREMFGVKPLPEEGDKARSARKTLERAPEPRERPSEEAEVYAELADLVLGNGPWDIADTDEFIEGIAPGLDRRLLAKLKKGEYAVQAHLDLHGLVSEAAHVAVERFVVEAQREKRRCVLIIHGRGLNSKDQIPVLKERVRMWLTKGRIARSVLCYCTARPVDGGAGAVYVLLRK